MTNEEILARIGQLEERRERFAASANVEIGRFQGQIEILKELLAAPGQEAEPDTATQPEA